MAEALERHMQESYSAITTGAVRPHRRCGPLGGHCEDKILGLGFVRIAEEGKRFYWHPQKRAVLLIYVDDFKLAAKREHQDELWKAL